MTTASPRPDRAVFGLPDNRFLFVTSVDIGSDMVRKNPVGAIDAFRLAFDQNAAAMLILKLNKSVGGAFFDTIEAKLRSYISGDPRIILLDSSMTYETILSLYASCDCYVSLHRAEGLGMGVMEAMCLESRDRNFLVGYCRLHGHLAIRVLYPTALLTVIRFQPRLRPDH
jgi:hypothetical protein